MLKPIETEYKGCRFRSRLEARWALFFDQLGLRWQYEPEGFDLGEAGYYLPDFLIRTAQGSCVWMEIKPEGTKTDEKFEAFKALVTDGVAQLMAGDPYAVCSTPGEWQMPCPRCGAQWIKAKDIWELDNELGIPCHICDTETPGGSGHSVEAGVFGTTLYPHKGGIYLSVAEWGFYMERLHEAAKAARSARFEYGEQHPTTFLQRTGNDHL